MTWTPEQVSARLAERQRYRAEHPEFDDWFLRTVAREEKREARRTAWRERGTSVRWDWGGASPGIAEKRQQAWERWMAGREAARSKEKGSRGRPLRRARVEPRRQGAPDAGHPDPDIQAMRDVLMREWREGQDYRPRCDAERGGF
jgi:hypothetical protein